MSYKDVIEDAMRVLSNPTSPEHYKLPNGAEVKDVIKASIFDFAAYCHGNVIKYVLRANKKNGIEDFRKAKVYLEWLIEELES